MHLETAPLEDWIREKFIVLYIYGHEISVHAVKKNQKHIQMSKQNHFLFLIKIKIHIYPIQVEWCGLVIQVSGQLLLIDSEIGCMLGDSENKFKKKKRSFKPINWLYDLHHKAYEITYI